MKLESEIKELRTMVEISTEKINRIELAVCGDEKTGIEGFSEKVLKNTKDIQVLKRYAWIGIGIVLILGTALNLFNKIT